MNTSDLIHGGKNNKNWDASQIYTAGTPPPPSPVFEKPLKHKNSQGGTTGSLLQKLDACVVRNAKDEELAFNIIAGLIKSLKEFNHQQGDTKLIEILTEIDMMFKCLRSFSVNKSQKNSDTAQQSTSNVHYSNINLFGSSDSTKNSLSFYTISPTNSSGIWYTQGRRNTSAGAQTEGVAQKIQENTSSQDASSLLTGSGYTSDYGTDRTSRFATHMNYYNTGFSSFRSSDRKQPNSIYQTSQGKSGTKDTSYHAPETTSAYTYQEYSSNLGNRNAMEMIQSSNEPPSPEKSAVCCSSQGYRKKMPPVYFPMTSPLPPYNP